jgi:hypothetical protein
VVLGRAIRAGVEEGIFRAVDPEAMSVFISTFLDGCLSAPSCSPASATAARSRICGASCLNICRQRKAALAALTTLPQVATVGPARHDHPS